MKVRSGRPAGGSAETNLLAFLDLLAFGDLDLRQVHVQGHELLTVIDDDAVAFVEKARSQHNRSAIRRQNGRALLGVVIQATMNAGELAVEGAARPKRFRDGGIYGSVKRS